MQVPYFRYYKTFFFILTKENCLKTIIKRPFGASSFQEGLPLEKVLYQREYGTYNLLSNSQIQLLVFSAFLKDGAALTMTKVTEQLFLFVISYVSNFAIVLFLRQKKAKAPFLTLAIFVIGKNTISNLKLAKLKRFYDSLNS